MTLGDSQQNAAVLVKTGEKMVILVLCVDNLVVMASTKADQDQVKQRLGFNSR